MMDDGIRRLYRLALRAYPRSYRRERGAEILATIEDAAEAGHGHHGRELFALVRGGLGRRLFDPAPSDLSRTRTALLLLLASSVLVLIAALLPMRLWCDYSVTLGNGSTFGFGGGPMPMFRMAAAGLGATAIATTLAALSGRVLTIPPRIAIAAATFGGAAATSSSIERLINPAHMAPPQMFLFMYWRVALVAMLLLVCGSAWISRRWSPTARAGLSGALAVTAGVAIGAHFLIDTMMRWDDLLAADHIDAVTHRIGLVGPAQLVLLLAGGTALAAWVASRRARQRLGSGGATIAGG